jgi:3-isopropylmalate dehydrogenase
MLLEHLGRAEEAKCIEAAVADDLAGRGTTSRSTSQIGDALVSAVA